MVDRYLWSHYADLCGVDGNGAAMPPGPIAWLEGRGGS